jgi:alpha-glucosidase
VAAVFEMTVRGTSFLYYGEEIALRDVAIPPGEIVDPPAKLMPDWWNRDQARAPMPWSSAPNGGFTTAPRPWLRMSPDYPTRDVAAQAADPGSVLSLYRRLIWFRRDRPALNGGSLALVELGPPDVLAYTRTEGDEAALAVLGFGDDERTMKLPPAPSGRGWRAALSTHGSLRGPDDDGTLVLRPLEALILVDDERELRTDP